MFHPLCLHISRLQYFPSIQEGQQAFFSKVSNSVRFGVQAALGWAPEKALQIEW